MSRGRRKSRARKRQKSEKERVNRNSNIENIYQLDGRVPVGRAIPYGLQHVLAMFVANLTPITIIAAAAVAVIAAAVICRFFG